MDLPKTIIIQPVIKYEFLFYSDLDEADLV